MNYRKTLRIFFVYLGLTLVVISLIGGCSRNKGKSSSKKPGVGTQQSKAFEELQQEIAMLVKEFEKTFLLQTAPLPRSGQGKEKLKGESEEKEGAGKQEQLSSKSPEPDWAALEKNITQIHTQWNSFQSEILEKGVSEKKVKDFSDKLNELTMTLTRKELYPGLLAANDLYEKTTTFEELYEPKVPPEFKKIIYFIRKATYHSLQEEQSDAIKAVFDASGIWESVKPKVKQKNTANRAEFGIKELEQAIKERDPNLIKIKAHIAEKNIQDVIKSMEKGK